MKRTARAALSLAAALIAIAFETPAFAQAAPPATSGAPAATASAPPAATPPPAAASTDANAASTTPENSDSASTGVTAHPPRVLPPGEQAGIPQSDERRYVRSPQMKKMMARDTTWDLNVELGYGRVFRDPAKWEGFFRGGAGIMFVRDPLFEVLRFTYDYSPRSTATLGVELEADWVETGLWGQIGLMKDANSPYWGGRLSLGFALFGVEGEYRGDATTEKYWALYGKLRLPLGIIGRALQ